MTADRHVYESFIGAPDTAVWEAIVDPGLSRRYYHDTAFASPPVAGEPYLSTFSDGRPAVEGVVLACEPPKLLRITWHTLYREDLTHEPPSTVEWRLDTVGDDLTRLRVTHGDLGASPLTFEDVRNGWVWILDALKTLVETGRDLPYVTIRVPRT